MWQAQPEGGKIPAAVTIAAVTERSRKPELLDTGHVPPADVERTLRDLSRINRLLGGWRALRRRLLPRLAPGDRVLDAGCGGGGMARRIARRARVVGLDRSPDHLAAAREGSPALLAAGDLVAPPFADGRFDYTYSTLVLHHLEPDELLAAVQALARVTRTALVLHDLIRVRRAAPLFRLLAPLLRLHPVTLHDGLISIRRAYTPRELQDILRKAGFPEARIHVDRLFCRMTAVIEL